MFYIFKVLLVGCTALSIRCSVIWCYWYLGIGAFFMPFIFYNCCAIDTLVFCYKWEYYLGLPLLDVLPRILLRLEKIYSFVPSDQIADTYNSALLLKNVELSSYKNPKESYLILRVYCRLLLGVWSLYGIVLFLLECSVWALLVILLLVFWVVWIMQGSLCLWCNLLFVEAILVIFWHLFWVFLVLWRWLTLLRGASSVISSSFLSLSLFSIKLFKNSFLL